MKENKIKMKERKEGHKGSTKTKRRKINCKLDCQSEDTEWMTTPPKAGKDKELITKEGKEWA